MFIAYLRQLVGWVIASAVVFGVVVSKPWWPKQVDRLDLASPGHRVCGPAEHVLGEVGRIAVGMEALLHLEVTQDGRWALTAPPQDGRAYLVDLANGRLLRELATAGQRVAALAISRDGRHAAVASGTGGREPVLELWDLSGDGKPRVLAGSTGPIRVAAFSADGGELHAAGTNGALRTWSVADGRLVRTLEKLPGAAWDLSGKRFVCLASRTDETRATVRDLRTNEELASAALFGRDPRGSVIGFSPDLMRAFVSYPPGRSSEPRLEMHDLTGGGKPLVLKAGPTSIQGARLTGDGRRVVTIDGNGCLTVWDARDGRKLLCLRRDGRGYPWSCPMAVLADGRIVCSRGRGLLSVLRVPLDRADPRPTMEAGANLALSVSADGQRVLAVGGNPPLARLLDASTGREVASVKPPTPLGGPSHNETAAAAADVGLAVYAGYLTASDRPNASAGFWGCLLSLADGGSRQRLGGQLDGQPRAAATSPDGRLVLVATANSSRLYGSDTRSLAVPPMPACTAAAFSPDGTRLACVRGSQLDLRLAANAEVLETLTIPGDTGRLAFSPDGRQLAFGTARSLVGVLDVDTGKEVARLDGHRGEISAVAFSRDGGRLASAGRDGTVRLWDLKAWRPLARWDAADTVDTLAFSPDGRLLAGGPNLVQYLPLPAERRP